MLRRPASVIGAVVLPLMFTLLFASVFREVMERAGIDYAQHLIPAVVIQAMFFTAMSGAILAAEDATGGMVDRLRSLPIARSAPVLSLLGGELARAVVSLGVLLAAGYALGFRFHAGFVPAVGFVVLALTFTAAVCLAYVTLGFAIGKVEPVQALTGLIFYPLLLGSNAFSPTAAFPEWLQPVVAQQPVSRVADALRALSTDGAPAGRPVMVAMAWIVAILVAAGVSSARVFGRVP